MTIAATSYRSSLAALLAGTLVGCAAAPPARQLALGTADGRQTDAPPPGAAPAPSAAPAPAPAPSATTAAPSGELSAPVTSSDLVTYPPDEDWRHEEKNYMWRVGGWITIAVGAIAGAVAIGTSVPMLHYASQRSSDCNAAKQCNTEGLSANSQLGSMGTANAVAWTVAVIGTAVGVFILLTHPPPDKDKKDDKPRKPAGSTALGVSPFGTGVGLQLRSTF